ncbi:MAG: hypothetical protein JEY96_19880 [Bacteroidales bacterium]|nr:hypothetical protein [Bacteroidales bacterium]
MINRLDERKYLRDIFENNKGTSTILIIYARTGVGKSCLADTVFSAIKNISYIRVKVNKKEAEENDGIFVTSLARALDNYASNSLEFINIEEYVETTHEVKNEKIINDIIEIVADLTKTKIIKSKVDYYLNHKNEIIKNILKKDTDFSITFLLEYIKYISQSRQLVLSIENIHIASSTFIAFLKELLSNTQNLFIIGEFTTSYSEDEVIEFFHQFDCKNFIPMELKKLEKGEIIGALNHISDVDIIDEVYRIIEDSYDSSQGNLRNLNWLIKKNSEKWNFKKDDLVDVKYDGVLHFIYSGLSSLHKMVLWQIVSHSGRVHMSILKDVVFSSGRNWDQILETISFLKELDLIYIENKFVGLIHDSLFELLIEETDHLKFISIANSEWLEYYRKISLGNKFQHVIKLGVSEEDILLMQLTFIINIGGNSNIDWMNYILSEIDKSLNGSVSSVSIVPKIIKIFNRIVDNNENKKLISKTYEWIIIILYKLGYSKEICNLMTRHNPSSPSDLLFLIQSSARISSCDTSVIDELLMKKTDNNEFLKVGLLLLQARYYRTFNQANKSKEIWHHLLKEYVNSPYKNVILEYSNICSFNIKKRLKFLKLAEKGFEKEKNYYHLCSVHLNTISNSFYLYFWKLMRKKRFLKIANYRLKKIKEILPYSYFPFHIYINQKNIVNLVSDEISNDIIESNFRSAYLNCELAGNKSLIGSNILAHSLKVNRINNVENYVSELMDTSRTFNKINCEFARYHLLNCFRYYKKTGNKKKMDETLKLFSSGNVFKNGLKYFIEHPFYLMTLFSRIKYYPTNIVNWDIDFQEIHEKYN